MAGSERGVGAWGRGGRLVVVADRIPAEGVCPRSLARAPLSCWPWVPGVLRSQMGRGAACEAHWEE